MRLDEIYREYGDQVSFYCVYIQEAHPSDGWAAPINFDHGIDIDEHKSIDERAEAAASCVLGMNLKMPMLIDGMDNKVDEMYAGKPDWLYVLDKDGAVTYVSKMGPVGFDVDAWEKAIQAQVAAVD